VCQWCFDGHLFARFAARLELAYLVFGNEWS
jgi:hypothetical protein